MIRSNVITHPGLLFRILSYFILALAVMMLIPLGYSVLTDGRDLKALSLSVIITAASGGVLCLLTQTHTRRELKIREGILVTSLVWISICFFGGLPFYFTPYFDGFSEALFESTSGFTTTGATVLGNVEQLSSPIQLWRCFIQWLGGMGIVMLGIAILPLIGQGGAHLYRAEFSGAKSQRLAVRSVETAKALWQIYVVLTVAEFFSLWLAGMSVFDAICHSFTTVATGGFSTHTASIAGFSDPTVDYLITFFMLCSGISFIQYYRLFMERDMKTVCSDYELRYYLIIILIATAILSIVLCFRHEFGFEPALRAALFQVVSIITTTGFVTQDYASWYPLATMILFTLMFVGGCTGSTAGGLKVMRVGMLVRVIQSEFKRMAEPHGVFPIVLNGEQIPQHAVQGLLNLIYLAWLMILNATVLLTATGVDILTALSATVACLFNVGPGLGGVGPTGHYGDLAAPAQWVLAICMIAGRLEFYTLLLIFTSIFWRR